MGLEPVTAKSLLEKPLNNFIKMQPFEKRYFSRYNSAASSDDHTYYSLHTNKVVFLGLQTSHSALKGDIKCIEILAGVKKIKSNNSQTQELGKRDCISENKDQNTNKQSDSMV